MGSKPELGRIDEFRLDPESFQELQRVSDDTKVPVNNLMGMALRMLVIVADAKKTGKKVLVTSKSGYPIREIFIPEK